MFCLCIILCHFIVYVSCGTKDHAASIFLRYGVTDYCDERLKCNNDEHTLCSKPLDKPCPDIKKIYITEAIKMNLLNAHNGLRNRAASHHNVSGMRQLEWDDELQTMAQKWLKKCLKTELDPCTQLPRDSSKNYTRVNQNNAFVKSKYLPKYYETAIITSWYSESRKSITRNVNGFQQFTALNNYTQLVWPESYRIGCSLARYLDGYRLTCNYYTAAELGVAAYKEGLPCSKCPRDYPLRSLSFENLCTADKGFKNLISSLIFVGSLLFLCIRNIYF